MATYLDLINRVRGLLREESVGAIAVTDVLTAEVGRLINRSVRSILSEQDWTFDIRHDGFAFFMAPFSGTTGSATKLGTTYTVPGLPTAQEFLNIVLQPSRIVMTDDPLFPNSSYRITQVTGIVGVGPMTFTLASPYRGATVSLTGAWTVYSDEYVLPSTVRRVLSCRHEETPILLEFAERNLLFDQYEPRTFDRTQTRPEVAIIGGSGNTSLLESYATAGTLMRIWPAPSADTLIHYSYLVERAEMTAAADVLSAVPEKVLDLITQRAFYYALTSNLQNDPERARLVRQDLELDIARTYSAYRPDPYRRYVPAMHGSGGSRNPRSRWSSSTIPSP